MKKLVMILLLLATNAWGQTGSYAPSISGSAQQDMHPVGSFLHLIPMAGVSQFATDQAMTLDSASGSTYGGFLDLGGHSFRLEVGGLHSAVQNQSENFDFQYWLAPLYLKWNLLGGSKTGMFMKLGAAAILTEKNDNPPVFASGGLGLALAINNSNSIVIDATYNRCLAPGNLQPGFDNFNGLTALAGLSIEL